MNIIEEVKELKRVFCGVTGWKHVKEHNLNLAFGRIDKMSDARGRYLHLCEAKMRSIWGEAFSIYGVSMLYVPDTEDVNWVENALCAAEGKVIKPAVSRETVARDMSKIYLVFKVDGTFYGVDIEGNRVCFRI